MNVSREEIHGAIDQSAKVQNGPYDAKRNVGRNLMELGNVVHENVNGNRYEVEEEY